MTAKNVPAVRVSSFAVQRGLIFVSRGTGATCLPYKSSTIVKESDKGLTTSESRFLNY